MSAELLREAAAKMRAAAEAATRGPWVCYPTITREDDNEQAWTVDRPWDMHGAEPCTPDCGVNVFTTGADGCGEDSVSAENAYYIATMHPAVALAVADWLDTMAQWAEEFMGGPPRSTPYRNALAVARAYLGETQ